MRCKARMGGLELPQSLPGGKRGGRYAVVGQVRSTGRGGGESATGRADAFREDFFMVATLPGNGRVCAKALHPDWARLCEAAGNVIPGEGAPPPWPLARRTPDFLFLSLDSDPGHLKTEESPSSWTCPRLLKVLLIAPGRPTILPPPSSPSVAFQSFVSLAL